ncbi:MAG: DNA-directed RNA polymerase subunit omega [Armatimonadota bacterium]|nr:DNA-directed RNA polymerase subunit omega [Armatimonadota bacterium]MCX7778316.1 DNA-directed RNA polymerase subunit omega [Armatimonadota bacterium]MDW8025668.1 DNA-directed RNA polymerase subunit omega [Armatimonadota bacterium]
MSLDDVFRATSKGIRNKYLYTLAVAQRARSLIQEAAFLNQPLEGNPVIMALKELREGKITIEVLDEDIKRALEGRPERMLP